MHLNLVRKLICLSCVSFPAFMDIINNSCFQQFQEQVPLIDDTAIGPTERYILCVCNKRGKVSFRRNLVNIVLQDADRKFNIVCR